MEISFNDSTKLTRLSFRYQKQTFPENRPMILHTFFSRFILTFHFNSRDECLVNEKRNELHRRLYEQNISEKLNEEWRRTEEQREASNQPTEEEFLFQRCSLQFTHTNSTTRAAADREGEEHVEIERFHRWFVVQLRYIFNCRVDIEYLTFSGSR